MTHRNTPLRSSALAVAALLFMDGISAAAASPATVQQGRLLFERNWPAGNPTLGSDGLGPLFNGQSCVACHNQAGVGGGGAAEFNAHTIGIEQMQISGGQVDNDVVRRMLRSFHPGFVQSDGTVLNTMALSHHGGTPLFAQARSSFLSELQAEFSRAGGPISADEVRFATTAPVLFNKTMGRYRISLRARLFQRNTTALYGAGLIDQVSDRLIKQHVKAQEKHPEISGRPSTLRDGRYGKFGWRANVATLVEFTDQACANEVGLETRRKPQASDPMNPDYRNGGIDVTDEQIETMRDFIAALPAPTRIVPDDSLERQQIMQGEQLFASLGCSVCHVPDLGPAKGVYSDLLLHDMGYESIDLNHAEPYIVRVTPQTRVSVATGEQVSGTRMVGGYYGPSTEIKVSESRMTGSGDFSRTGRSPVRARGNGAFHFVAPAVPARKLQLVDLNSKDLVETREFKADNYRNTRDATVRQRKVTRVTHYVRVHFEPTNFNQEWRTPPLWGVADSAPYMHDGRAETLLEAISLHDGESAPTRDRFLNLPLPQRRAVIAFLRTLVAPPDVPQVAS